MAEEERGDDVLKALGFVVNLIPAVAERFNQEQLNQAVVANDLQGDSLALIGERDPAVGLVLQQIQLGIVENRPAATCPPDHRTATTGGMAVAIVVFLKIPQRQGGF